MVYSSFFSMPPGHGQGWAVTIQATQTSSRTTLAKVRFPLMGRSWNVWLSMEHPIKTHDFGVPLFQETLMSRVFRNWKLEVKMTSRGHKWKDVPTFNSTFQAKPTASPKKLLIVCYLGWISSNILSELGIVTANENIKPCWLDRVLMFAFSTTVIESMFRSLLLSFFSFQSLYFLMDALGTSDGRM